MAWPPIARPMASSERPDRKSTRLNSSHVRISYAVFCLLLPPPSVPLFPYTTLFRSRAFGPDRPRRDGGEVAQQLSLLQQCLVAQVRFRQFTADPAEFANPDNGLAADRAPHGLQRAPRSEEHTSELQSRPHLVCRLLLATAASVSSTLSLHDALPISRFWPRSATARRRRSRATTQSPPAVSCSAGSIPPVHGGSRRVRESGQWLGRRSRAPWPPASAQIGRAHV